MDYEAAIESLKQLTDIQCSKGNWDYDPYMHGMANGMIFALSIFNGGDPDYLDAPEQWGKDVDLPDKISEYGNSLKIQKLRTYESISESKAAESAGVSSCGTHCQHEPSSGYH